MVFTFPTEPLFNSADGQQRHRLLGGESGDENGYFLNNNDSTSYPSYSVSWRYLGLFIDCSNKNNNNGRRHLEDNNNNYSCQRNVLWAAYHDKGYKGGSIGEYSFYDNGKWDSRTCRARTWWPFTRCQRLNCHEKHSKSFELVGVFKETNGLYDWTEQLFKHQGYCLWDGDKDGEGGGSGDNNHGSNDAESSSDYQFMQNMQEKWITYCTQLEYVDSNGNALYVDTKPLPNGDMTYGIYTDYTCMTESSTITWSDYLSAIKNNNGDEEGGGEDDNENTISISSIERWNTLLDDYKVCQPCRAYNRIKTSEGGSHDSEGSHDEGGSGEDDDDWYNDDGEGRREQYGFNCYDDAGYLNCNQCYKFETQTNMEPASTDDLERASSQGTILAVKVDGKTYGKGHYKAPGHYRHAFQRVAVGLLVSSVALGALGILIYYKFLRKWMNRRRFGNGDLKEGLAVATCDEEGGGGGSGSTKATIPPKISFPVVTGIPLSTTSAAPSTTTKTMGATTADVNYEKEDLLVQIQERDVKLSQQEQLIAKLQEELDSYKQKEKSVSSSRINNEEATVPEQSQSSSSPTNMLKKTMRSFKMKN